MKCIGVNWVLRSVMGAVVVDANWVDAIEKMASRGYMK